jgi:putative transposase
MKLIDRQYLITPYYGARKIAARLKSQGYSINRKWVRRLMRLMGLRAIYRRPRILRALGHGDNRGVTYAGHPAF